MKSALLSAVFVFLATVTLSTSAMAGGIPAPVIQKFMPDRVVPGTTTAIRGANLCHYPEITVDGIKAKTWTLVPSMMVVFRVPKKATSGQVKLSCPNGTASGRITLTYPQKMTLIVKDRSVPGGTLIAVRVQGAPYPPDIYFNERKLNVENIVSGFSGTYFIYVRIPKDAHAGVLSARFGSVKAAPTVPMTVINPTPAMGTLYVGRAGALAVAEIEKGCTNPKVTVLQGHRQKRAKVLLATPTRVLFRMPQIKYTRKGNNPVKIQYSCAGRTATGHATVGLFRPRVKATITGTDPVLVTPDTWITLKGSGFTRSTQFRIGIHKLQTKYISSSKVKLYLDSAALPHERFMDNWNYMAVPLMVKTGRNASETGGVLLVKDLHPYLKSINPPFAWPNRRITVTLAGGKCNDPQVRVGNLQARLLSHDGNMITFEMPAGIKRHHLTVMCKRYNIITNTDGIIPFRQYPLVRSIDTPKVCKGRKITITGQYLGVADGVYMGSNRLIPIRVSSKGKKATFTAPASATGSQMLFIGYKGRMIPTALALPACK